MSQATVGELKPCERCGSGDWLVSNPMFFRVSKEGSSPVRWAVTCKKCGIKVEGYSKDETEAIWNTRPIEDALRSEIYKTYADYNSVCKRNLSIQAELTQAQTEIDRLHIQVEMMKTALESLRNNKHYKCEDCWYSCPKDEDYCGDDRRDVCTCGTDRINTIIDRVLKDGE